MGRMGRMGLMSAPLARGAVHFVPRGPIAAAAGCPYATNRTG